MRLLLIHSEHLEYEAKKKAVKTAEEVEDKVGRAENCLVAFMAVEKPDEDNPDYIVDETVKAILETREQVKADSVVVYPYAHLSSSLSSLDTARKVLNGVYEGVKNPIPNTIKAPFGWYKSFELKCKGHPLSELSRTILPEGYVEKEEKQVVSEALKKEEKIKSSWHIMTPDGVLHDVGEFDYKNCENLKKLSVYEKAKDRTVDRTPPHIELMRKLELVDYEPASDPGNFRYYPKGKLIKALLEQYVTDKILEYGGVEVETPLMYDFDHPTLAKYLNRFPARQYTLESDKKRYFMRFAACFGQFLMAHDATISYRNLPLRLYELARYAFRREKSGELTGLRRLRSFTMPDVHALCSDVGQALEEYKRRFQLCRETIEGIGLSLDDVELAVRFTKDFYDENKDFVQYLVKSFGKPALIEMWDEKVFYFILKYEFNFVDALDKASALSTDQVDVENGERYDIEFVDKDNKRRNPVILHCSPSGAIERIIYALLEKAYMNQQKGLTPSLPVWLCPTQVRVVPVSEEYVDLAEELCSRLTDQRIRADFDDRDATVGSKIRDAEKEWTPYIIVVGEKEKDSGKVTVRVRGVKEQKIMELEELVREVNKHNEGKPYRPLPLPRELSKRPKFVG